MAERLGRVDLESAALDGIASAHQSLGRYGMMEGPIRRRLDLAPKLADPYEVGDIHAMAAWWALSTGRYRESVELASRGFTEAMPGSPIQGLYCLDFRAAARFRRGDWDGVLADVALAEELLGERRIRRPGSHRCTWRSPRSSTTRGAIAGPPVGTSSWFGGWRNRRTARSRSVPVASAAARSTRCARGSRALLERPALAEDRRGETRCSRRGAR